MSTGRAGGAALAALLLALGFMAAPAARAQSIEARWQDATWVDDLNFAGANVVIAGLTGGVVRKLRGGSFSEGFTRGALGGAVLYAGKRITVARFTAAGLLGRQVGAVGSSITRSAAFGTGVLDTLVLPLGPLRAYVPRHGPGGWSVRVDAVEMAGLIYALEEDRLDFDLRRTLESGVAVFTTPRRFGEGETSAIARELPGFLALSTRGGLESLGHERVHVVQRDFAKIAIGLPLEDALARAVRLRALPLLGWVDLGVGEMPFMLLASQTWWGRPRSLLEVEADFLESR